MVEGKLVVMATEHWLSWVRDFDCHGKRKSVVMTKKHRFVGFQGKETLVFMVKEHWLLL